MTNKNIELSVKVIVTKEIQEVDALASTRELVDAIVVKTKGINYHNSNQYKYYSYDGLPKSKNKKYSKDEILKFRIRLKDLDWANSILTSAKGIHTDKLMVLGIDCKVIPKRHIESIYTLTPVIVKFEEGYWRGNKSIEEVEQRIKINLIKKYNNYYNTKIDENFELFEGIEIKNKYPITIKYKGITLLGDKFLFKIASNEQAQELANFSIACGVGELNARGLSFVRYNWL